jgi:5'-deoxynucleotidase YfbR-like HD superfamily hydrolase
MSNNSIYQTAKIIRRAGNVRRFHTHRMIYPDHVNVHSFNAGILAFHIASRFNKHCPDSVDPYKCSFYMLMHDVAEHIIGDIPGHIKVLEPPVKEMFDRLESEWMEDNLDASMVFGIPNGPQLNEFEAIICSFCDKFEAFQTCYEELRTGNYSFKFVYNRINALFPDKINKITVISPTLGSIIYHVYNDFRHDCLEKFEGRKDLII